MNIAVNVANEKIWKFLKKGKLFTAFVAVIVVKFAKRGANRNDISEYLFKKTTNIYVNRLSQRKQPSINKNVNEKESKEN